MHLTDMLYLYLATSMNRFFIDEFYILVGELPAPGSTRLGGWPRGFRRFGVGLVDSNEPGVFEPAWGATFGRVRT